MLSINADSKTVKGLKKGYLTGILYLAPHTSSGINVCPDASPGCISSCLYSAGRGAFNPVKEARINKTHKLFNDRDNFFLDLVKSIEALKRKAKREGFIPVVRLNGTSDLPWEKIRIAGQSIMSWFPEVQFYDYTKTLQRVLENKLPNYHLTLSASEINLEDQEVALASNYNVAVVFHDLPVVHLDHTVISGDDSDLRFLDDIGVVIGLTPKGKARKDTSGFVV